MCTVSETRFVNLSESTQKCQGYAEILGHGLAKYLHVRVGFHIGFDSIKPPRDRLLTSFGFDTKREKVDIYVAL